MAPGFIDVFTAAQRSTAAHFKALSDLKAIAATESLVRDLFDSDNDFKNQSKKKKKKKKEKESFDFYNHRNHALWMIYFHRFIIFFFHLC